MTDKPIVNLKRSLTCYAHSSPVIMVLGLALIRIVDH